MNLKRIKGDEIQQAADDGYTPIFTTTIEYSDGRLVVVPDEKHIDVIRAERHFKKAYAEIMSFSDTNSWMCWTRLKRHEDKNERPSKKYDEWLEDIRKIYLKVEIDLDEELPLE